MLENTSKENTSKKVDPRIRRTREMLQKAMNDLLKEKGFFDLNVQDIAERAELNRATFYKHYLDKYDLLDVVIRQRLQTLLDDRLPPNPPLTSENLSILIQLVYDCLTSFHGDCRHDRSQNEHSLILNQLHRQIYEVLLNWLQSTPKPPNRLAKPQAGSPEITALLATWLILGPLMQVVWGAYKVSAQEAINEVTVSVDSIMGKYLAEEGK